MGKTAGKKGVVAPIAQDGIERSLLVAAAKRQFVTTALNMSWQLALTIVIPVIIGVKLDDHYDTAPSYTLAALFIAVGIGTGVVWSTIKQVNREQAEASKGRK